MANSLSTFGRMADAGCAAPWPRYRRECKRPSQAPKPATHSPLAARGIGLLGECFQEVKAGPDRPVLGSGLGESLIDVGDDIIDMLDPYRKADEVFRHARPRQFVRSQLAMGRRCRVTCERFGVADVHQAQDQVEGVDELTARDRGPAARRATSWAVALISERNWFMAKLADIVHRKGSPFGKTHDRCLAYWVARQEGKHDDQNQCALAP